MAAAARASAAQTGLLPHEFLLSVMRGTRICGGERPSIAQRLDAAKAAAPYFAPRMASLTHDGGITVEQNTPSDLEAARRITFLAEMVARELEGKRPDLAPVDRKLVMEKVLAEFAAGAKKEPLDPKIRTR